MINPTDIGIICRLLGLPDSILIYDPSGRLSNSDLVIATSISQVVQLSHDFKVCVNLSEQALEVRSFDYILAPGRPRRYYNSFAGHHFLGFNNPDGTLRWFQPARTARPHFLHLYNGSGAKAKLIKLLIKGIFSLRLQQWFSPSSFTLYTRRADYFEATFTNHQFAFFTGTVGENRKAVKAICANSTVQAYLKIPISEKAQELVNTEYLHLKAVEDFSFKTLEVPTASWHGPALRLSNIKPSHPLESSQLMNRHIMASQELLEASLQRKLLSQLAVYQQLKQRMMILPFQEPRELSPAKKTALLNNLSQLYDAFRPEMEVASVFAHGDFTPWNMFVSTRKIHLYDWELAMPEQLPLYDLIHYIFQANVLIHHSTFAKIKQEIEQLKCSPMVQAMLSKSKMDFGTCYCWYLLNNCSYYLHLYAQQEQLHVQANWLVDCWIEATQDAILTFDLENNAYLVYK